MPSPVQRSIPDETLGPLPHGFAAIMRPELPSLQREIVVEIRRAIPQYAEDMDGPHGATVQRNMEQNLVTFVDKVDAPAASTSVRDALCRRTGRYEAYKGRDLDLLQTAFRIGARVALRRARKVGKRYNLSPGLLLAFADALFAYVEELLDICRQGYLEAKAEMDGGQDGPRRRLLRLLLTDAAVPPAELAALAGAAGWTLPEHVTLVALSPGARPVPGALGSDVLADFTGPRPHLLVPGEFDDARRAGLRAAARGLRAAVGPTLRRGEATESLRWARRTLSLVESGIVEDVPVVFHEDHLVTLWLMAAPALTEQLATRQLAPLAGVTPTQRERLIETLRAWFASRGNAVRMAEILNLHPQTVRYRLRLLERAFGDRLHDFDHRFATEVALRALRLREQQAGLPLLGPRSHPDP